MISAAPYLALGWRLIPIVPGGKRPAIADWVKLASSDPAQLSAWAAEFPGCNLGVATGSASGFFVLDVDPRNGGDQSLADLPDLPPTVTARTPSGGFHFLFRGPPGLTNSAGRLGPGLDTRGEGGQIVIAPSFTDAGSYSWERAPWDHEIADAPAWLLERLRTRPASATTPNSTDRGYFPPASPEVLAAARQALENHGPAVNGDGGGLHTVHAAAILTHDFALSDDEAWPIFEEWNRTCVPPWDLEGGTDEEPDLRIMLGRGKKYGKLPYGCKRTLGVFDDCKKWAQDWADRRGTEQQLSDLLQQRIRPHVVACCNDPTMRAAIERELVSITGHKPAALALPKVKPPPLEIDADGICITTQLAEVADLALQAIADHVFARNGELVTVARNERTFIHELDSVAIQDLMSRHSQFYRIDDKGAVTMAAPLQIAQILHSRRTHPGIRVLEAVTTAPVFLADGTILQDRGYNAQARVYLEPSVSVTVPDEPTRDDARAAVLLFKDLLCDFKFAHRADFSSWLAGLLSPLIKAATGNAPAPLICVSASSPGAGKSLLSDLIARIITGKSAEIRSYNPRDPAEWQKRITAFVKSGAPVNVLDNVNGAFGDQDLDRLITSSTWSDRQLGASEAPPLPIVGVWFATGNNIEPIGDTVRRVLTVRIEVDVERPQERSGFKRPLLAEYALENRAGLLGAALTILRAYHVAGRPDQGLPPWGSFGPWSALVRGALTWTGCADPFVTQARASSDLNEPENDAHDFWLSVVEESDGSAADITARANARDASKVLGLRETMTPIFLRRFLGRFVDKPRAGKRIRRSGGAYRVEAL